MKQVVHDSTATEAVRPLPGKRCAASLRGEQCKIVTKPESVGLTHGFSFHHSCHRTLYGVRVEVMMMRCSAAFR